MVKNHSDSERGNPLPSHGLLFPMYRRERERTNELNNNKNKQKTNNFIKYL